MQVARRLMLCSLRQMSRKQNINSSIFILLRFLREVVGVLLGYSRIFEVARVLQYRWLITPYFLNCFLNFIARIAKSSLDSKVVMAVDCWGVSIVTKVFLDYMYFIDESSIWRPSDSIVSEDAGIEVLRLWHWQSDALTTLFNFEMWIELR